MENTCIYDEELIKLRDNVERLGRLEREIERLCARQSKLEAHIDELRERKYEEQRDVEKLEGRTLVRLFYYITGRTDEKLSKEKEEALAAAAKYDAAKAESYALNEQIGNMRYEISRLSSCEARYAEKLKSKRAMIRAQMEKSESGNADYEELIRLDDSTAENARKLREIDEAISAGESARGVAERVISSLESADGFAAWDIMGGGLIADLAKHEKIDEAQELIETLQIRLSEFRTELVDVDITADMSAVVSDTLKFADFFFDGLIADIMVADRISKSLDSVKTTRSKVAGVVHSLEIMRESTARAYDADKARLDELTMRIKL